MHPETDTAQSDNENYCLFFMTSCVILSKSKESSMQPPYCMAVVSHFWLSGHSLAM